jgi:hypothetical protein
MVLFACVALPATHAGTGSVATVVQGWLSDEACARGRAKSGVYSGTNPDCAKRCVAQGKRIVLIVPDEKSVLDIANQDAARENIGDEVQATGTIDPGTKALHIDSLKMLSPGRAMCQLPPHQK